MKKIPCVLLALFSVIGGFADSIPQSSMQAIYNEVKTPYKYGLVIAPEDNYHKIDCPTVFREGEKWLMTYVCYDGKEGTDGRGYETWLAESADLLHWTTLGRILSFKDDGWDMNQRGGFPSLIDWTWDGSYGIGTYKNKHWMTYIGGHGTGYEAVNEPLNIGLAWTRKEIGLAHEWESDKTPLLSINDKGVQWWEHLTQYKSTVYDLNTLPNSLRQRLGAAFKNYRFVMFYNAGGKDDVHPKGERIGIALSKDMKFWKRYNGNPVFAHDSDGTITGDAQIVRMGDLFVMFYFSAFNPTREYSAYNTFAVSRDLVHWQDWEGPDLIAPSKPYDELFAHKSYVVKHDGVVYHFYCAVNNEQQRGIAVATSHHLGRSDVRFPEPEQKGPRHFTVLNDGWEACRIGLDTIASQVNLPHNFDDYYGYRQLRHGNLHGSAIYNKVFSTAKHDGRRYFLEFQGVGTYATVTLNGHEYPRELVGRTVWTLDVTDALCNGDNHLTVLVDHPANETASPWVCGGCSSEWGFSEGSQPFGIFRPVTLVETDVVRIEPFGVHIWNNAACDSVFIETEVKNYSKYHQYIELVSKFAEKNGKVVFRLSESMSLAPGETRVVRQTSSIADAHRWCLSNPYLYTLTSMVKQPEAFDGDSNLSGEPALITTDLISTPYGIRNISWPVLRSRSVCCDSIATNNTDHRFYLNGTPVFINGTCEYEHLLGASHAFTPEQIRSRVKQIHNAGFNAFREAHQPHNLLYQQLFDEQGILFWSQFSAHIWYDTPEFRDNFKRLLVRWIKERRNSPSVILWGLQNESALPRDFAEECSNIIRSLDPTCGDQRAITTCNGGEGTDWNVVQNWSGTYGGSADNYAEELAHPDQLLNGEYGAWRTLDLHGDAKYSEESFTALLEKKARLAEQAFSVVGGSPVDTTSVCGHFQWLFTSHDNPGRIQPDGALRRIDKVGPVNYKGLTTIWEEPTQAYYMYRQRYAHRVDDGSPVVTAADRNHDLVKGEAGYHYLCRINCGGDAYTDEFGQYWLADDSLFSHSWGQDFPGIHPFQASQRHITEDIRGTQSDELFQFFRFGRHRLWYDLHVPSVATESQQTAPLYRIELYFTEPWHGKDDTGETADYEGLRIFDVAVNDSLVINDLDPWAEAGYCGALKRVVTARAKDGKLRISFPEVKAGQAVICGIAIAVAQPVFIHWQQPETPIWHAFDTDTIAKLPPELLPVDTDPRPAVVYEPQPIAPMDVPGLTSFIIHPGLGQEYALRFRYKNLTGLPYVARLQLKDANGAMLVDRDITFPPTPDKFKMISTTTGTQINAGTYHLTIEAAGLEFKNVEIQ